MGTSKNIRAKALLRKEIYSEALASASATCQFLEIPIF